MSLHSVVQVQPFKNMDLEFEGHYEWMNTFNIPYGI